MTMTLWMLSWYVNSFPQDDKLQIVAKKQTGLSVLWDFSPFWAKQSWKKQQQKTFSLKKIKLRGKWIYSKDFIFTVTFFCWINYLRDRGFISGLPWGFWKTNDIMLFISSYTLLLRTHCSQSYCHQACLVSTPIVYICFLLIVIYISTFNIQH